MTASVPDGAGPCLGMLTVLIVTRARVERLRRAIRSLTRQADVALHVHVVVDDCPRTSAALERITAVQGAVRSLRWTDFRRTSSERSGPRRVAKLRQAGLSLVETPYCAFLDDDNTLETNHFSSLISVLRREGVEAAHSWRSLWTEQGGPYLLQDSHPWCRDDARARALFVQYRDAGIYEPGSQIVRDQVVPHLRSHSMVDTSEWLFRTAFIQGHEFCQHYSRDDWLHSRAEDSKLLDRLVEMGLTIPSTRLPTLHYYLGGYSNNWSDDAASLDGWE